MLFMYLFTVLLLLPAVIILGCSGQGLGAFVVCAVATYHVIKTVHVPANISTGHNIDCVYIQQLLCSVGTVTLPAEIEMVMPGDNVTANFELIAPVAMEAGLRFALREGGRTVGAGVVSEVTA